MSIIGEEIFNAPFPITSLQYSQLQLKGYSGELSSVLDKVATVPKLGTRDLPVPLFVVNEACPTLLGREWKEAFEITASKTEGVSTVSSITSFVEQCSYISYFL